MNKTKFIKKSILIATIGILAFSLIPVASAGTPRHVQERPWENNLLMPWWYGESFEFSTSEDLYFKIGWASTYEEIENDWAPKNPWKFKLFINNEEINLQRYDIPISKEDKSILSKQSMFYHVFGPGYFEPEGEYLLRFEFWVKRPYQDDGLNHWRIFVDYWGVVWGAPGEVASYEYYLTIVE